MICTSTTIPQLLIFGIMSNADLFILLNSLPDHLRKQVTDFIEFLMQQNNPIIKKGGSQVSKKPIAGLLKGKIWIAEDFDAPLDDFKDHM